MDAVERRTTSSKRKSEMDLELAKVRERIEQLAL
jgi:hypothetical protein